MQINSLLSSNQLCISGGLRERLTVRPCQDSVPPFPWGSGCLCPLVCITIWDHSHYCLKKTSCANLYLGWDSSSNASWGSDSAVPLITWLYLESQLETHRKQMVLYLMPHSPWNSGLSEHVWKAAGGTHGLICLKDWEPSGEERACPHTPRNRHPPGWPSGSMKQTERAVSLNSADLKKSQTVLFPEENQERRGFFQSLCRSP